MSCWPNGTSTPSILLPDIIETPFQTPPHGRQDVSQHIRQQNPGNKRAGLELGESSVVKQRKLRSEVWKYFVKDEDENGKDRARCKGCQKYFDGSSKSGTTHLRNHYRSCQRKRHGDGGGDEPPNLAGNLSNPIAIKEKSVMDQELNRLDVARKIIKQGDASLINSTNKGYIVDVYEEEKGKLRKCFEKLSCRLCLTVHYICDSHVWSNSNSLVVWFIDDDWKLKNQFICFNYRELYETTVESVKNALLEWGIENNLSSMVIANPDGDNGLYETIYDQIREGRFGTQGSLLSNKKLLCNEILFPLCPLNGNKISPPDAIRDLLYVRMSRHLCNIRSKSYENENVGKAIDVAIKSLGKEETVQVILTHQEWLKKVYRGENNEVLRVLKDVLSLKETFFELENSHPDFQNLTKEEWDVLRAICEYFEDFDDFLSQYNTANTHFPLLCGTYKLVKELRKFNMEGIEEIHCFRLIERVDNYWCKNNLVLAVASVLDPRFRLDIVKNWYKKIFGNEWETEFTKFTIYFTDIYHEYARGINKCTSGLEENNASFSYEMLDHLGKLCKSSHEGDHVQWLTPELRLYFEEVKFPSIKDFDILEWWRVHARYFPTLAGMARDFLSIQMSYHPVPVSDGEIKCIINEIGDSDDEMDDVATSRILEAYACTKIWLREEL